MSLQEDTGPRYRQQGVTLIEQVTVIAIVAVLTGIALPAMGHLLQRDQLRVAQGQFIAALRHAREAAVDGGGPVVFCPSRDHRHCDDDGRWDDGWLLGRDRDHDHQPEGAPLRVGQTYSDPLVIHSTDGRHFVRFRPDGSASGTNLTLSFCRHRHPGHALLVVVSQPGRVRGAEASASQAQTCAAEE